MADEAAEVEGTNGVSNSHADARAAFLAGDTDTPKADDKPAKPAREVADDDSDLDDDTSDDKEPNADEDPDADLDEDSEASEDEDEDEDKAEADQKADTDRDKRLAQVRRTDKRLREQREKDWASRDAEFESRVNALKETWQPRIEAAEKFEKLAARAAVDPVAVLRTLGVGEDRYEYIGKLLYNLSKKDDPNAKAAAAQLMKSHEVDAELADLKKWREDREKTEKEREQQTAADRQLDSFFRNVTGAATDKTPLAASFVKANPTEARERLQVIAFRLAKESGKLPEAKRVMIELEKDRRKVLRDMGIDPKSRGAAAASNAVTDSKKTEKKVDKKTEKRTPAKADDDDKKLSPRDAFIRGEKFD